MGSCLRRNLELPRALTGSRRRQGSILQPLLRRRNGFLPSQEPRIAPRVCRVPAQAGIHRATARAPEQWGSCLRRNPDLRRMPATEIGLGIAPLYRIPAQAGIHRTTARLPVKRVPAGAGTSICPARLPDPGEGRDPSCNRSSAGDMGSCLRRNPELPRAFAGSRRRQGSILQPLLRRRHGFLPAQEPKHVFTHREAARSSEDMFLPSQEPRIAPHGSDGDQLRHRSSLPDPGEGRDPSCNRSSAGDMGSCLRRNPSMCLTLAAADPLAVDRVLAADKFDIGRAARIIDFERPLERRNDCRGRRDPLGVEAQRADHL